MKNILRIILNIIDNENRSQYISEMKIPYNTILFLGFVLFASNVFAQSFAQKLEEQEAKREENTKEELLSESKVRAHGYGTMNYFHYDWETLPDLKDEVDIERFVFEIEYFPFPKLEFEAAIEVEHGGTGSTLELERLEEFGEFESEIEKGGEVLLEEFYVAYEFTPWLKVRAGKIYVNVGPTNLYHLPNNYFTVTRPEAERFLIPLTWQTPGLEAFGNFSGLLKSEDSLLYSVEAVTALDSTGFSDAAWVAGGKQEKFERSVLEDIALVGFFEYSQFIPGLTFGASGYIGNSTGNRIRNDLEADTYLSILSTHARYERHGITARAFFLYSQLQNSEKLTEANRNLSNNQQAPRTPVGSAAMGYAFEMGYNILPFLSSSSERHELVPFIRYEFYDSMYRTKQQVFDNPRHERTVLSFGFNLKFFSQLILKTHYSRRELGLKDNNIETTFALGLGVIF